MCLQWWSVQAELLSPIKDACHVWVVCSCFLVMPGPSGSSQVNKSMSFDKHASHPHAHVLPGAGWFIRVNITDVWKPPMRPNPFIGMLTDSMHTHARTHTHTHTQINAHQGVLKLERTLLALAHTHTRSSRCVFWWQCVYHQPTHKTPDYSITCGTLLVFIKKQKTKTHSVFLPKQPPPLLTISNTTSLRQR